MDEKIFIDDEHNEVDVAKSPSETLVNDVINIKIKIIDSIRKNDLYLGQIPREVKAEIKSLYLMLYAGFLRDDSKTLLEVEKLLKEDNVDEHVKAYKMMDVWMDKKRIIRMDNVKHYDRSSMEKENRQRGY